MTLRNYNRMDIHRLINPKKNLSHAFLFSPSLPMQAFKSLDSDQRPSQLQQSGEQTNVQILPKLSTKQKLLQISFLSLFSPQLNMALQQHFTITYFAIKIQKLKMQFSVTYIITRKSLRSLLSFNDKKRLQQAFKLSHQVNPSDSSKYPREKHKIVMTLRN